MKVVIVGARGFVGSALARVLAADHDVVSLAHGDLDISHEDAVKEVIARTRPGLTFNCAVVGVDACELDPQKAYEVNVRGAQNVAEATNAVGAELVHFSSNYVFDGKLAHGRSYTIDDQPAALNVYGATKLAGELAARASCERAFVVRTSWVFGRGKPSFLGSLPRDLRERQNICAIRDLWASPTFVNDLVTRVLEIVSRHRYATYHVVNTGACTYYDFAIETARVLGLSESRITKMIQPAKAEEMHFAAERPRYTPLFCKASLELGLAPLRDWRAAVRDYVEEFH